MKISELQNISLSHIMALSKNDLQKLTAEVARYSNRRLQNLEERGLTTPATEFIKKHGGDFKATGDIYELRAEFQRAQEFLKTETSTVGGFKRWESKIAKTLKTNTGIRYNKLTAEQKRNFWKAFSKLGELDINNIKGKNYNSAVNEIYDAIRGGLSLDEIDNFIIDLSQRIYTQETDNPFTGKNDPFNY